MLDCENIGVAAVEVSIFFDDIRNGSSARPAFKFPAQFKERLGRPDGVNLDASIREILGVPRSSQLPRHALRKIAKADSLNDSGNVEAF